MELTVIREKKQKRLWLIVSHGGIKYARVQRPNLISPFSTSLARSHSYFWLVRGFRIIDFIYFFSYGLIYLSDSKKHFFDVVVVVAIQ